MDARREPTVLPIVRNRFRRSGMDSARRVHFSFGFRSRRFLRLFSSAGKTFENRRCAPARTNRRNEKKFGQPDGKRKIIGGNGCRRIAAKHGEHCRAADASNRSFGETGGNGEKSIERRRADLFLRSSDEKRRAVFASSQRQRSLLAAHRTIRDFAAGKTDCRTIKKRGRKILIRFAFRVFCRR